MARKVNWIFPRLLFVFFFIFTFVFTVEFLNIKFGVLFYHIHESDSFILAIQNVTLGKIEKKMKVLGIFLNGVRTG